MPPRGRALEVLVDCPTCGVEGARVELIAGEAAEETRCRLCGERTRDGVCVEPAAPRDTLPAARARLLRWAAEEDEPDVEAFVRANFGGSTLESVCARLVAGERVETSLEVVAWLFGGKGAFAGVGAIGARLRREDETTDTVDLGAPEVAAPRGPDPRDATRALCAVAMADGRVHPAEEPLLTEALAALGCPAPLPEDRRVWRPNEVGTVPDPAATLAWMRRIALADGEADPSEVRLLRAYARAWRTDLEEVHVDDPPWWRRLGEIWAKARRPA
jgi:hypothetical protein